MSDTAEIPSPVTPVQTLGLSPPVDSNWSQSHWQAKLPFPTEDDMPKKKRARITKEQLAQLEHHFAVDCSPTTAQRREIGLQIGVPERRIQIWFQNRRAKARNHGENGRFRLSVTTPLGHPPELAQATQMELAILTQEDGPIFIIPCTNITIGAWNRVGSQNKKDLLAWICDSKKTLTWFIRSDEYCFKMRMPLEHVVQLEYSNGNQVGQGIVTIDLSQPPEFFLRRDITSEDGGPSPGWRPCNDWTEDKEASRILRHVLGGAALPLSYIVGYIRDRMAITRTALSRQRPLSYPPLNHGLVAPPTPAYPPSGTKGSYHFSSTYRQSVPFEWDAIPRSEVRYSTSLELPFSHLDHNVPPVPEALGLNSIAGYPYPRPFRGGLTPGFVGTDMLNNTHMNSPSPLLVPLRPPHSQPHTPDADYDPSLSLPGFSELLKSSH